MDTPQHPWTRKGGAVRQGVVRPQHLTEPSRRENHPAVSSTLYKPSGSLSTTSEIG
jgi:hypothetical protein